MNSNRPLDLVLVNPGNRSQVYQGLGQGLSAIEPPVWAGLMASFVRNRGYEVRIVDAGAEGLTPAQMAARVDEYAPRLVAVVVYGHQPSASTQNMPAAGVACQALKEHSPERPVLLVGGHVASLPDLTMRTEAADFVSTGEGLHTLVELLEALREKEPRLEKVRGLGYRQDGRTLFTPDPPLVKDLDGEIPGIDWDLLPMDRYRAHNWHCFGDLVRQPYAALYTSLGCPYKCSFCCIQAPFKTGERAAGMREGVNSYRTWSSGVILDWLEVLVTRYGVRNLKIADEMFVLNPRHVLGLCEGIRERGYDLNIWAYARVDTVRDAMIQPLKAAGFHWLAFGIEAAGERVRDDVSKGYRQEDIFRTLDKVRAAGVNVIGNYIFGLPEDDRESMQQTLDLALELNCEFANFYCAMAYPGSQLYEAAQREGWPLPQSWSGYSQHSVDSLPLPTRHLSAGEVLAFRDHAFQVYFHHPPYLEMIERRFGRPTVEHILQMASQKLERRFVTA